MNVTRLISCAAITALAAGILAAAPQDTKALKGSIRIDGSSTVYPITEAVAEEFDAAAPGVKVNVGRSGTGGGFKRFTVGETDVSNASRPIKKSEADMAASKSIEYVELPVAYDGLTIVTNKSNTWATQLTIDQVKKIFSSTGGVKTWKDVDPSWPAETIKLYAPGTDSGTFDYFKEVVVGKDGTIRGDMSVSEDDNVLVRGVEGDKNALGFFGYAYFVPNKAKLNSVAIVNPKLGKAIAPTATTIEDGTYAPFSRPLFIYVNKNALAKPEVMAFAEFYLAQAPTLAAEVGYVPLPAAVYARAKTNLKAKKAGSQFIDAKGDHVEGALTDIYK